MTFLSSLQTAFFHCGVYPFFSMLTLQSLSCRLLTFLSFSPGSLCLSFSAKACAILLALRSTNKFAISFLLPFHPTLFHLSFYLNFSGRNYLLSLPVLPGYNGSSNTRFSREKARLMSWPDGERYSSLGNPLWSLSFLSRIHSFLELEAFCLIHLL